MSVMTGLQTSQSSPLRIAEVCFGEREGRLGLTLCPGKKDPEYGWDRDLHEDLRVIRNWGARMIISLIETHEFSLLQVPEFGDSAARIGISWIHLPIQDVHVPDDRFESGWSAVRPEVHHRIGSGERILIHCRGGLGRTGLVAARILVERGCAPRDAVHRIRAVRPGAIETLAQEQYVHALQDKRLRALDDQG
jgi:ADP-ribosyl-[dinitrogen reductase] hydrolase